MRDGIYRLYRLYVDDHGRQQRRLAGRFLLYGEQMTHLEDHDGVLETLSPNGHVTAKTLGRLQSMSASPYWELVHEDEVQAGHHEHLLPEYQDAGPAAWPTKEE